jgi:hypothetical protein
MKPDNPHLLGERMLELAFGGKRTPAERDEMLAALGIDVDGGWERLQKRLRVPSPAVATVRRTSLLAELAALLKGLGGDDVAVFARQQLDAIPEEDLELMIQKLRQREGPKP